MCLVLGCGAPHKARGMCEKHYQAWWRGRPVVEKERVVCSVAGCDRSPVGLLLCRYHYNRWTERGTPIPGYISEPRVRERHTFPYRRWLVSTEPGRPSWRPRVHAQSWVLVSGNRKLVAACSLRIHLDPTLEIGDPIWCEKCTYVLRRHGLIA